MHLLAPVLVLALAAAPAFAQSVPPSTRPAPPVSVEAPPAPPTREELGQALGVARQRMALQEGRIAKLSEQMVALDKSVESQVTRLVDQIKSVEDSPESKTRVAMIKQEAIAGLKKSIDFYVRERNLRTQDELRKVAALSDEQLAQDVHALNQRVEKRIDQILAITASMQVEQGYQRYETYWDGDNAYRQETDRYRQNKLSSARTGAEKDHVIEELQKSIETLKQKNEQFKRELAYDRSATERAFLEEQIEQNRALIDKRRLQIQEAFDASSTGRELSSKAAFQMEQMIDDMVQDLRKDFNEFVRLARERDNARAKLKNMQAQVRLIEQDLSALSPPPTAPVP